MDTNKKPYQSWTLIIMAYNEAHTIERVYQKAVDFLSFLPYKKKEILIINDGSTDDTLKKIKDLSYKFPFTRIHSNKRNAGIGSVLKKGYLISQMENICAVPADGQFDFSELKTFRNIPSNTIISFYRTSYEDYSLFRKFLTWMNRRLNKIFFGFDLRDVNWIKIYKRDSLKSAFGIPLGVSPELIDPALKKSKILSRSSYVESEICYYLKDHKIVQIPIRHFSREYNISKSVRLRILGIVFLDVFRLLRIRITSIFRNTVYSGKRIVNKK